LDEFYINSLEEKALNEERKVREEREE